MTPHRHDLARRAGRAAALAAAALTAALSAPAPAAAQQEETVYRGLTVSDVHDILVLNGLRVVTETVDGEDVVADNRVVVEDFARWFVYLYNCEADGCRDMEFRVAYSEADPSLEAMNYWNNRYRFTRAYRSRDGYAVLSMDISAQGGITVDNISAMIPLWRRAVARFANSLAPDQTD